MGERRAEDRHDIVAHVFINEAAIALDDGVHRLEVAVEQRMGLLGAELARKIGVAGDVGKQNGDLAAFAGHGGEHGRFRRWFDFTL